MCASVVCLTLHAALFGPAASPLLPCRPHPLPAVNERAVEAEKLLAVADALSRGLQARLDHASADGDDLVRAPPLLAAPLFWRARGRWLHSCRAALCWFPLLLLLLSLPPPCSLASQSTGHEEGATPSSPLGAPPPLHARCAAQAAAGAEGAAPPAGAAAGCCRAPGGRGHRSQGL